MNRREASDLSGIGAYDERYGRVELARYHIYPASGVQGHRPLISCWCYPTMLEFHDEDGLEYWRHHEGE